MKTKLCCLKVGETATVMGIGLSGPIRRRLLDIGLVEGTRVKCIMKSSCGDPTAFQIRGAVIALRKEDSGKIIVKPDRMCV